MSATDAFRKAKAASLVTFRRDGTPVPTAIWFYVEGDKLFTTTHGEAGKLKRLAHTTRVEIAVCSQSGKVKGPVYTGAARVLDPAETDLVMLKKQKRYPIHKVMMLIPKMRGQVGIEISPGPLKVAGETSSTAGGMP
jgi:uncharacterized protein